MSKKSIIISIVVVIIVIGIGIGIAKADVPQARVPHDHRASVDLRMFNRAVASKDVLFDHAENVALKAAVTERGVHSVNSMGPVAVQRGVLDAFNEVS